MLYSFKEHTPTFQNYFQSEPSSYKRTQSATTVVMSNNSAKPRWTPSGSLYQGFHSHFYNLNSWMTWPIRSIPTIYLGNLKYNPWPFDCDHRFWSSFFLYSSYIFLGKPIKTMLRKQGLLPSPSPKRKSHSPIQGENSTIKTCSFLNHTQWHCHNEVVSV